MHWHRVSEIDVPPRYVVESPAPEKAVVIKGKLQTILGLDEPECRDPITQSAVVEKGKGEAMSPMPGSKKGKDCGDAKGEGEYGGKGSDGKGRPHYDEVDGEGGATGSGENGDVQKSRSFYPEGYDRTNDYKTN